MYPLTTQLCTLVFGLFTALLLIPHLAPGCWAQDSNVDAVILGSGCSTEDNDADVSILTPGCSALDSDTDIRGPAEDLICELPGMEHLDPPSFKQYSGYLRGLTTRRLHYWLVSSFIYGQTNFRQSYNMNKLIPDISGNKWSNWQGIYPSWLTKFKQLALYTQIILYTDTYLLKVCGIWEWPPYWPTGCVV